MKNNLRHQLLNEYTTKSLLTRVKRDTPDRVKHRNDSGDNFKLYRVGMAELNLTGDLYLYFKISGYKVGVRFIGFSSVLDKYLDRVKDKSQLTKVIMAALKSAIRTCHIQVSCTCPDFRYRFAYTATLKGFGLDTNETRPATKTNPKNKGGVCKHIIRVLNSPSSWTRTVVPAIRDYILKRSK